MTEFLFESVPFEEAADWIKSKPVVSQEVFSKLLPALKSRAICIAGVEAASVVQRVRDSIAELPRGGDWAKIKKSLVEELHPFLSNAEDPENTLAAERRAELLLRTHGFQAYQAANVATMRRQADVLPYWQYLSMQDGRVRAAHRALEGKVLRSDHPFWRDHTPPWEWGCRCQIVPLSEEDVADLQEADKDKPIEQKRVMSPEVIAELERTGHLVNGPTQIIDVRSPKEKGQPGAFEWDPEALTLPLEQLKGRYDAPVWEAFETWAQGAKISPNLTVWEWLNKMLPKPEGIPSSLAAMKKVKTLGGSTGAELWKDVAGRQFVVKRGNSAEHITEEFAADQLYRTLGVPVPEARLIQTPQGPVKIAQYIEGQTLKAFLAKHPSRATEIYAKLKDHFVADALLGNWDVAGLDLDNILIDAGGIPWRIDNGGSLRHRAQGTLKTAAEWNDAVGEIDSLRDPNRNAQTARIFSGITDAEIRTQIEAILAKRSDFLAAAGPLAGILEARLDTLARRLAPPGQISAQLAADVRASRILGRTYLGDKELIEDHSILFWQERDASGQPVTRAKLRLTEAGWAAIKNTLGAQLANARPASITGPQPLAADVFWPQLLGAIKTVNVHASDGNYNAGTMAAFEQAATALAKFSPKTPAEKAMKAAYEATVADVRAAIAAKKQTKQHSQYLFTPPPPAAQANASRVRAEAGEMVYAAKSRDKGHAKEQGSKIKTVSGAYRLTVGDVEITFAPWEKSVPYAHRGMATLRVNGEATAERMQAAVDALKEIGVDAAPTSRETSEIVYIAKTLRLAKPDGDWQDILTTSSPDSQKLAALKEWTKKKLKIDLDNSPDYQPGGRANAWGDGWRTWNRFDLPPSTLRAELLGYALTHRVYGSLPDFISSLLDGGGQITPTMERMRVGVPIGSGMSPDADQGTGGANYFFTRIATPEKAARHHGLVFKIDLLARADAYSFPGDYFGDVRPAGENQHTNDPQKSRGRKVADYKRFATKDRNETILKNSVNLLEDIDVIRTSSPAEKQAILQTFAKHGISALPDGRQVKDIIQ